MKQPPILFGANVYGSRREIEARREYCRLHNELLEYVELPTDISLPTIRQWSYLDGFAVSMKIVDDTRRIYRAVRIAVYTKQDRKSRIIKLKRMDRFGFSYLKPGECITYGPFFSTPKNYRHKWKEYLQGRVRALKKGSFELLERPVQNHHEPTEFDTAYIVRRIL